MAIKTFTTGEVLTASDTNTYLANSGLVFVKSQTIGSAVSSVNVTSAFNSTYDSYLIQINGGAGSGTSTLGLRLGAKTTNYRYQFVYGEWTNTPLAAGTVSGDRFEFAGSTDANGSTMSATIMNPNLAKSTRVVADCTFSGNYSGVMTGLDANTTQYTDFTIVVGGVVTLTGGTINVYGFRKG
jgi:hypothetical protein